MSGIPFFARRFVAGVTLEEAIQSVLPLGPQGIQTTLDILGENVKTELEARQAFNDYCKVVDAIARHKLRSYISIKLTMLGLDMSETLAEDLLKQLLLKAQEHGIFIRLDMEGTPYTEKTVSMFLKVFQQHKNLSIVLQAYLKRTAGDVDRVNAAGGRIRLCKGAYREPANLAFQSMGEIRENYLKLARKLMEKGTHPAFATHDDALIDAVKALAREYKKSSEDFEFQMLYGLRRPTWSQLVKEGYNIRIYVPFGTTWYPYFSRRLRERKENVLFILTNLFKS